MLARTTRLPASAGPGTRRASQPATVVQRRRVACGAAPTAAGQATDAPLASELDTLRRAAARPGSVAPGDVLAAMVALEKARLRPDGWEAAITAPGTRWRLIYTVPAKAYVAATKKQNAGVGGFFPLAACQKFEDGTFENGVFLGPVGHLTFKGPFRMEGKVLHFDVTTMVLGIGPWRLAVPLKKEEPLDKMERKAYKALPFFVYAYAADIVVARGRSGGVALWGRADADWLASTGALAVYS